MGRGIPVAEQPEVGAVGGQAVHVVFNMCARSCNGHYTAEERCSCSGEEGVVGGLAWCRGLGCVVRPF